MISHRPCLCLLASLVLAAGGCVGYQTPDPNVAAAVEPSINLRSAKSMNIDGGRFLSGPYPAVDTVRASIPRIAAAVRINGQCERRIPRGIVIPDTEANKVVAFCRYTFTDSCGGDTFGVIDGNDFQALIYFEQEELREIIDFYVGPTFVRPGLWTPYDQTLDTSRDMCMMAGDGEQDGLGFYRGSYNIGRVTSMLGWEQERLGTMYEKAIARSATCKELAAVH